VPVAAVENLAVEGAQKDLNARWASADPAERDVGERRPSCQVGRFRDNDPSDSVAKASMTGTQRFLASASAPYRRPLPLRSAAKRRLRLVRHRRGRPRSRRHPAIRGRDLHGQRRGARRRRRLSGRPIEMLDPGDPADRARLVERVAEADEAATRSERRLLRRGEGSIAWTLARGLARRTKDEPWSSTPPRTTTARPRSSPRASETRRCGRRSGRLPQHVIGKMSGVLRDARRWRPRPRADRPGSRSRLPCRGVQPDPRHPAAARAPGDPGLRREGGSPPLRGGEALRAQRGPRALAYLAQELGSRGSPMPRRARARPLRARRIPRGVPASPSVASTRGSMASSRRPASRPTSTTSSTA